MLIDEKVIQTVINGLSSYIKDSTQVITTEKTLELIEELTGIEPAGATFDDGESVILTFEDGSVMTFDI